MTLNRKAFCGVLLLLGLIMVSGMAIAMPIPEPRNDLNLKEHESIAFLAETPPTIDGDLSDWEHAAFLAIDKKSDLFRGAWGGPDDLSYRWALMWDKENLYFAAALWDDVFTEPAAANQPWMGDCMFLYIDADVDGTIDNKPSFVLIKGKESVKDWARGGLDLGDAQVAIVFDKALGKAGRFYEIAIPYSSMQNMNPKEGGHFRMMPGYDEGNPPVAPGNEAGVFMDWGGLNPDQAGNLGKVTFGEMIKNWAVSPHGKLTSSWGDIKNFPEK